MSNEKHRLTGKTPSFGETPPDSRNTASDRSDSELERELVLPDHVILVWDDKDAYGFVASRYVRAGLEKNERCICAIDDLSPSELRDDLASIGVDTAALEARGQLHIVDIKTAYRTSAGFNPAATIAEWGRLSTECLSEGYTGLRVVGEATFAIVNGSVDRHLIEYESSVNAELFHKYPFHSLCVYNKDRYPADILRGVIQAHPVMLRNKTFFRNNIYYIPPEHYRTDRSADDIDYLLDNIERGNEAFMAEAASRKNLLVTLNSIGDAVIVTDNGGAVTMMNPAAERLTGWSADEAEGLPFEAVCRLVEATSGTVVPNPVRRVLSSGKSIQLENHTELHSKSGERHPIADCASPICSSDDSVVGVVVIIRDETDRVRKNLELKESLREKELLLREVHHRVKNNLNVIQSLISFEIRRMKNASVLRVLNQTRNRIQSIALIHNLLYRSTDIGKVDFPDYCRNLIGLLSDSFRDEAGRVAVRLDVEKTMLAIEDAKALGLIINEAATNTFKYAFPGDRTGTLRIRFRKGPSCELSIDDDGIGLPPGFAWQETDSMGFFLMRTLTEELDGDLDVSVEAGTHLRVRFNSDHRPGIEPQTDRERR